MIFDARPKLNADANRFKGGGYEDCSPGKSYSNCQIQFCDIGNIHDVRTAFEKMCSLPYNQQGKEKHTWNY